MDGESYKVRISVLWLLAIVAFFAYRTLALDAQAREVSLVGEGDFASYLSLLMVFAFLSLFLSERLNRPMNLIAGGIFLVLQLIMLTDGLTGSPSASFNVMTGATVVALAAIVWLAFRWPGRSHQGSERTQGRDDRVSSSTSPGTNVSRGP
jgi:hypothetical protein